MKNKSKYLLYKSIVLMVITFLKIFWSVTSDAKITAVTERTVEVRDAIIAALPHVDDAGDVTTAHLAGIISLNLRARGIHELKSGDFSGLTSLTDLNLYGNTLSSLPDGIFNGLTALSTIRLAGNTVDPLPISISLEKVGTDQFKAVIPTGTPYTIVLPISVTNGSISDDATTTTITKGSLESDALTVTRTDGTTDAVIVNIGALPSLPRNHYGYVLSKSNAVPLKVIAKKVTTPSIFQVDTPVNTAALLQFSDGNIAVRSVAENSAADVNIGTAVAVADTNNDEITYSLSGNDADVFDIDNTTGQLKTKVALDYEIKSIYIVTITATDGSLTDTITVIIKVIDVDDTESFTTFIPVKDRTPEVRDAIVAALPNVDAADDVTAVHLVSITQLNLRNVGISRLKSSDSSGLTSLRNLNLYGNMLSSLPNRIFEGLTSLTTLRLGGNLANPIPLIVSLQQDAINEYRAVIPTGAPFDVVVPIDGVGNTIMVTIPQGNVNSETFTVTKGAIVSIGPLPHLPLKHFGYVLSKSAVCHRTPQVLEGIVTSVPGITDCRNISEIHLASITSLDLNNKGIRELRREDFSGLLSLASLDLRNNQLSRLPDGIFEGLPTLTTLHLDGNTIDPLPIAVSLERIGENQFKAVLPAGAPFAIALPLIIVNGDVSLDSHSITIPQGNLESNLFTITRTEGTKAAVTLDIGLMPSLPTTHTGYVLTKSSRFPIEVFSRINSAPMFTDSDNTKREIPENTASGENIGNAISATDVDNDILTYSLSGTDADAFTIDNTTGQLKTKDALDYETKTTYAITVNVNDGNGGTDSIAVTVNILDIDENRPPAFTDGDTTTRSVPENTETDKHIGDPISATDPDNDSLTYTLSGTNAEKFEMDTSSGQLNTDAALDYETKDSYAVTVIVSDGKLTDTISVTINILDVDEVPAKKENTVIIGDTDSTTGTETETTTESGKTGTDTTTRSDGTTGTDTTIETDPTPTNSPPDFTDGDSTTRSVSENTGSGVDIGAAVSATDADDDVLTYSLSGTDETVFSIDTTTGQLSTSVSLDYEAKTSYSISITVSDGTLTDSITVTINVTNVNEAPVFADGDSTTRSIAENVVADINIGSAVSANDPDGDNLTWTLGGTDAGSFSIDGTTGQLKTKATLDYETKNAYTVTITVSDGRFTDTITVTINVNDLDETPSNNPPVFTDGTSTTRSVVENIAADSNIGSPIAATDVDKNTLAYLLSGEDASSFNIVSETGQLKTSAALNHEAKESYTVTVTVSDGSGTDSITVTINITDVNEAPIIAANTETTLTVAENTEAGVNIGGALSATDPDDDELTYSLGGTDAASFSLVDTSGQLQTKATLDYETKASYSVTITVSDDTLADAVDVTINVTDVGENRAPVFTEGESTTREVPENAGSGVNIGGAVSATDADDDDLTYTLGGTDADAFSINRETGQLHTKTALDYETQTSYSVMITVSDGNGKSAMITVTIKVTDVDENSAPVFTEGESTTRSVAENTATGESIGAPVAATDADNDTLTYTLGGTDASTFSIVSTSGQLQTKAALDFETTESYSMTISVSDGNGGSASITVTISVTDVRDTITTPVSDRTPQIRDAIIAAAGVESVDDVTAAHLAQISRLNLSDQSITTLKAGDFSGLTAITKLNLRNNSISDISPLEGLTTLTSLDLYHCNVSDISPLDDMTALTRLWLNDNNVGDISALDDLTKLTFLAINRNEISDISALEDLTKITNLTLSYNQISDISALEDLKALTRLYLHNNSIIDISVFEDLTALTYITLDNNSISNYSPIIPLIHYNPSITIVINLFNPSPNFIDGDHTNRIVAENTEAGQNFGRQVTATDRHNDTLTYVLLGTDAESFSIVSTTGQLQTKAALDYETDATYTVIVYVIDDKGKYDSITVTINVTDVDEQNGAPASQKRPSETALLPNYPNPFNPETWIPYHLAKPSDVSITIYDIRGNVVRQLRLGHKSVGFYTSRSRAAHWDGRNKIGERVANGIYFYQLQADTTSPLLKMVILE